ncbi:serine/threonine-protein kinase [Actinomadura roseirufa]|uniref:serine/threonine-protein kinase n=1 Tax=Actinomadura roseirufa TaxID=2094049 RepID=UPI0010413785|nr:serine/threonine-protein kinase [Actinomadura roseirufa]
MRSGAEVAGRYRLVRGPIRGGMGEVWLAEDMLLPRQVILKRALNSDDDDAFGHLRAEARALARFSHPHVVTLFDAIRVRVRGRATSWLVLEYVPGGSLAGRPPVGPEEAARVGAQIADALAALHAEGIVHCDVKPGNIVIKADGTAKLTDFGAAYRTGARQTLTPNAAVSHTPGYAAPEVVQGRPEPASDVYSLGATLHALITGAPPGAAGAATSPDAASLREVLHRMLREDPAERPSPAEAREALGAMAGAAPPPIPYATTEDPGGPPFPGGPGEPGGRAWWAKGPRYARRHPWLVTAVGAAAAIALTLALTSPLSDEAGPAPRPKRPSSLLGDPREAEPCALVTPSAFGRFGETELDRHYGNFDRCDVVVRSGANSVVDVKVEFDAWSPPETAGAARTVGGFRVVAEPAEDDECDRTVLLPAPDGGTKINIAAHQEEKGPAPLCAIADVATAGVTAVLRRGPIARRSPPLPAASLAKRDACALLGPRALDRVPGIDAGDPDVQFARWSCKWHSTTRKLQVKLRFDQGQPLGSRDGRPTRLGGYRAFVEPGGDGDGSCLVRVVYRTFTADEDQKIVEVVHLVVEGDDPVGRMCSLGTDLAGEAAAALAQS